MDNSTRRGFAFLLSLGTLPIACQPDDKGETDATAAGTGSTGSTGSTGTTAPTTSTTGTGTDGSATDSAGSETGSAGGVCEDYAARVVECTPSADMAEATMLCTEALLIGNYYSPVCGQAYEEFFACLTGLPCADLTMAQAGCDAAIENVAEICMLGIGT